MADIVKALVKVRLDTDIRSLHMLYKAVYGARNGAILTIAEDSNLTRLFGIIEQILTRSGYMTDAELRAIRTPRHGFWEVK